MDRGMKVMILPRRRIMRQIGSGFLWDSLKKLGRMIMPLLGTGRKILTPIMKDTMKTIGKQASEVGTKIAMDTILEGKDPRQSFKSRVSESIPAVKSTMKKGKNRLLKDIKAQVGQGISQESAKRKATAIFFDPPKKRQKTIIFEKVQKAAPKKKSIFD